MNSFFGFLIGLIGRYSLLKRREIYVAKYLAVYLVFLFSWELLIRHLDRGVIIHNET